MNKPLSKALALKGVPFVYKYHIAKLLFTFILLISSSATVATQTVRLSSGEEIRVQRIVEIYMEGSKEYVLMLHYIVDSIDDRKQLRERANLIWEFYRPIVEKAGYSNAGIKAKQFIYGSDKTFLKTSINYTFVIQQHSDGSWAFLEDTE